MDWRGHLGTGFGIVALIYYLTFIRKMFELTMLQFILLAFLVPLYAVLPDIDSLSSHVRNFFISAGFIGVGTFMYLDYKMLGYLLIAVVIFVSWQRHRGLMHSIRFAVLFALPFFIFFGWIFASFLVLSYITHLVVDGEIKW